MNRMKKSALAMSLMVIALFVASLPSCRGGDDNSKHNTYNGGGGNNTDSDGDGVPDAYDCARNDPTRWHSLTFFPDLDTDDFADSQNGQQYCVGDIDTYPDDTWTLSSRPDPCLNDHWNDCVRPKIKAHWAYGLGTWTASWHWDCARPNNPAQPWQIEESRTGHDADTGNELIKVLSLAIVAGTQDDCRAVLHADPNLNNGALLNVCPWGNEEFFPSYNSLFTPPFCSNLAAGSPSFYVTWVGDWSDEEPIPYILEAGLEARGAHYLLWPDGATPPDCLAGDVDADGICDDVDPCIDVDNNGICDGGVADLDIPLDYDSDGFFNKCPDNDNNGFQDDPHCIPDSCMMIANEWSQDCGADGLCSMHTGYPGPDAGEKDTLGGNDGIAPECLNFDDDNDGCYNAIDPDPDDPLINCF